MGSDLCTKYGNLPEWWVVGQRERPILPWSSSDCRKGSIKSSSADKRSDTFAIHFSINALTAGSVTFANDAGFIPYKQKEMIWKSRHHKWN